MANSVYEIVTAGIIAELENGVVPWSKPWRSASGQMPTNLVSGKPYQGINTLILGMAGYASPYWVTFKQAIDLGGNVRKGEHGTKIVFWKVGEHETAEGETERSFLVRYYTVFHVSQCDGLTVPVTETRTVDPIETAEAIASAYPLGPVVDHGKAAAWYRPAQDTVGMPDRNTFTDGAAYYSALFHELTHSTGHANRLNRPGITDTIRFGSENYGKEELIAEIGAAFLCQMAGIATTIPQSAAYCKSWLTVIKADPKIIVSAASAAQKAVNHITGQGAA